MRRWLWHFLKQRNFLIYLLLLIAFATVILGLADSMLKIDLTVMVLLAVLGLSYGWLFSATQVKDWHFALLTIFVAIGGPTYYLAQLSKPLGSLINAIGEAIRGIFVQPSGSSTGASSISLAIQQLGTHFGMFFSRIIQWGGKVNAGQAASDEQLIIVLWGLAFWLAAVWAGWLAFRHHSAITAVLPATVIFAGSLSYVYGNPLYLIPLTGATLLLKALISYDQQERYWAHHQIDYAEDIQMDMNIVIPIALGIMAVSVIAPSVSIQQIVNAGQEFSQRYQGRVEAIAKSLGLEPRSKEKNTFSSLRNTGLPRSHMLGSGPELSKDVVMVIQTGDYPPAPNMASLPGAPAHYYWRSATYDVYTGHGWTTSAIEVNKYASNQAAIDWTMPITGTMHQVHQSIQLTKETGGMIYYTGQLISVDKDYQVAWRLFPPDNTSDVQEQIADEFGATVNGSAYRVESFINPASLDQLRAANGQIPAWIIDRYLVLPESLPAKVRQLAIDLSSRESTPYDRAAAIEAYLRTIPYTLSLPYPPANRDVVDYFLFDLKRGYCDYYATAMVVMARATGIPARLVTGYASGAYDSVTASYIVTAADAHSWAEIYLAGIGWVEFEPTGNMPLIQRATGEAEYSEVPELRQAQPDRSSKLLESLRQNWLAIIGGLTGLFALGIASWAASENWRLNRLTPRRTIVLLYQRYMQHSQGVSDQFQPGDTPDEHSNFLVQRLSKLALSQGWNKYFQHAIKESVQLTNLYTQAVYSPREPLSGDQKTAIAAWSHLHLRLRIAALLGKLQRSPSKEKATN